MRVAVWDFNGIVVDDVEAHRLGFNAILAMFNKAGFPDVETMQRATTAPYIASIENAGIAREAFLARVHETDEIYHAEYLKSPAAFQLRQGVKNTLDWVSQNNGINILLTNTKTDTLNTQLVKLGIRQSFTWISATTDRKNIGVNTNKTQRLSSYFTQLNRSVNAVMIGDSVEEPVVARELGLTSVAVTGGWFDRERLAAARPNHLFDCVSQLPKVLGKAWNIAPV